MYLVYQLNELVTLKFQKHYIIMLNFLDLRGWLSWTRIAMYYTYVVMTQKEISLQKRYFTKIK